MSSHADRWVNDDGIEAGEKRFVDQVEVEAEILGELERIKHIQTQLRHEPKVLASFDQTVESYLAGTDASDADSAATDPEPIVALMRTVQAALLQHPTAAAFVFRALVDEGQRYAETDEGQSRADALAADPVIGELRRLWEATSLNVLGEGGSLADDQRLPSGWVDLIVDSATSATVDAALDQFMNRDQP